jgi:hypothetical protein
VTSVGVPSDLPATCGAQRGLTLTAADGNAIEVGFSMGNAEVPTLESLQGRTVQANVIPDVSNAYSGVGELALRDEDGLVLSVHWNLGGGMPFAHPMSLQDLGMSVSSGTGMCADWCARVVHNLLFAGTTSVELAVGEQGTFEAGSGTYTAYAVDCTVRVTSSTCADGYSHSSWAVFRSDL